MGKPLVWSEELGRRVRSGDWASQASSTVSRIEAAVDKGEWEAAAELLDYFLVEAGGIHRVYLGWVRGFVTWLEANGVAPDEIAAERARLDARVAEGAGAFAPESEWEAVAARVADVVRQLQQGCLDRQQAHAAVSGAVQAWRDLHHCWVGWIYRLYAYVAHRLGEEALGRAFDEVFGTYLGERHGPMDLRKRDYDETLFRNLYLSFEAMRGHLGGPGGKGDIELTETGDAWVLEFDPCGSGNRALSEEVAAPGSERPSVTQGQHDWAWSTAGVCYYCAHCCYALQHWPVHSWGHPIRRVEPPVYSAADGRLERDRCRWTIYKTLDAVPEAAYVEVGGQRPRS